ncbi:hypothetical protein M440DRAFT_1460848, partial [Trichoderma longibrachiatum ATCC 18648]
MEPLRLKPRQPVEAEIENWDDDDFIVDGDELSLRPAAVTATGATNAQPRRRDSTSSHISLRSDLDSAYGEEQHVHLPADDERSTMAAIAAAERAGIPLPKNVPSSALTGGTIKRLGGKKMRKTIDEDWEHDLELPDGPQGLQMKPRTHADFPETLRQVSGGSMHNSPKKTSKSARDSRRSSIMSNSSVLSAALSLDRFRDTEDEEDDFFGDGFDTIKVAKTRAPQLLPFVTPPKALGPVVSKEPLLNEEDFEQDLELPSDGTLRLSARRDIPRAPFALSDDIDWGEGSSLGTRYGGTRRDARSTRSSSVSAMSPSLSSTFTVESEDETFDGLLLPPGHLNFQERLQLRKTNPPPEDIPEEAPAEAAAPPKKLHAAAEVEQQDFLEGLDIGDGNVFDAGKLTIHRNIKVKDSRLTRFAVAVPAKPRPSPQAPPPSSAAHVVDRNKTPSPWNAAPTAARGSYTPSFARDTAASRIARETALAHRTPSGGPLASVSAQRAPTRSNAQQSSHSQSTVRTKKLKRPPQLKPHLISNLSGGKESKVVKGMFYNADTYRWEGNENVLNAFDGSTTPSSNSAPLRLAKDKEPTAPRPALITNISTTKGVQVVGGMVFDPQNMCWLKLGPQSMAPSEATDSLDNFNGFEEEEDVFKDIPDLEDTTVTDEREGHASEIKDDWLVGEEFDVGPEFIRRQREEEERWRKKCEKWTSHAPRDREAWRWTIRELVIQFDDFAMPNGARPREICSESRKAVQAK